MFRALLCIAVLVAGCAAPAPPEPSLATEVPAEAADWIYRGADSIIYSLPHPDADLLLQDDHPVPLHNATHLTVWHNVTYTGGFHSYLWIEDPSGNRLMDSGDVCFTGLSGAGVNMEHQCIFNVVASGGRILTNGDWNIHQSWQVGEVNEAGTIEWLAWHEPTKPVPEGPNRPES